MPVRWSQALNFQTFPTLIKQRRNSDPKKPTFRIEKREHVAAGRRVDAARPYACPFPMSSSGTFRTWRNVQLESAMRSKADIGLGERCLIRAQQCSQPQHRRTGDASPRRSGRDGQFVAASRTVKISVS
jgi:hypothetical protein